MGLTNTTVDALQRGEPGATRERHTFVIERNHAEVIEVDDLQFHPGSSIALPAPIARPRLRENETISALSAVAQLLEEHGGRPLWIAGHADDGKSARFCETLAARRAQNVLALAQGDADAFAASCFSIDCKPLQSLLAWAARVHGLGCDPGPVSGENNAATRAALLRFRSAHAERFKTIFPPLLAASPEDYRAFFTLYELSLAELLEVEPEALAGKRGALTFHSPSTSGAGGGFPIPKGPRAQELRSSAGRRVDLVLFDPAVAIPEVGATGEAAYANELRALLTYVAPKRPPGAVCVRLTGMHFDTNKCFLLPGATAGLRQLVALYQEYPQGELLIVGHTDTAGRPEYNDTLSLERAQAVAAYLKDDVDAWLPWYSNDKPKAKRWGSAEDRAMLSALPDGATHLAATHTIKSYQASRGLNDDGIAGPKTRRQLIGDYMALDGTTLPAELTPVAHGCGESFPVVQTEDDVAQDENRRVELLLFTEKIDPAPSGEISKPGSPQYGKWLRRSIRFIEHRAGRRRLLHTTFALDTLRHAASQLEEAGFVHFIHSVLAADIPADAIRALYHDLPSLEHPPSYVVSELAGDHPAAYDRAQASILIHERILEPIERGEAQGWVLAALLLEEFGHHIDQLLRSQYSEIGSDSEGDEGKRFAFALFCIHWEELATASLATWQQTDYELDWAQMQERVAPRAVFGAGHDAQQGDLEFHGTPEPQEGNVKVEVGQWEATLSSHAPAASYPSYAAFARDSAEARRIEAYFAFVTTMKIYGLVEMARKLARRLDGQPSGLFRAAQTGPLDPRARVTVLQILKSIYNILDERFRAAPIGPDGLPEFTERQLGKRESPDTQLSPAGSPLAGIVEDVAPFGSIDGWIAELNTTRLPAIPDKPKPKDDLDWGEPPTPPTPPQLDPDVNAEEALIDLGRLDRDAPGSPPPSFDLANRNTTILDAVWTLAGELISGPAMEALGPIGAIGINYLSLYNTLSEVDAQAVHEASLLGFEIGAKAILNIADFYKDQVISGEQMSPAVVERYIDVLVKDHESAAMAWRTRHNTPAAKLREQSAHAAVTKLATKLRTALVHTESAAQLVPGYFDAPENTKRAYLHKVRVRVHREFGLATLGIALRARARSNQR